MTNAETIMMLSMGVRIVFAVGLLAHVVTRQVLTLWRSTNCVRKTKKLLLTGTVAYVIGIFLTYPIMEELVGLEGDVPIKLVWFSLLRTVCVIVVCVSYIKLYRTTETPQDRYGFGDKQKEK
jgi:hypothetical protein